MILAARCAHSAKVLKGAESVRVVAVGVGAVRAPPQRLRGRLGENVYQMAAYDLPLFSRSADEAIFPSSLIMSSSPRPSQTDRQF